MITATCPNDPQHKRFITVAHVAEDWIVDEHGDFVEVLASTETVARPDPDNTWTCAICGADAKVEAV